jgi:hypothetical protein
VAYGEYLKSYREAYGLSPYALWLPNWLVSAFVYFFHLAAGLLGRFVPYLQSVDYLLQVATSEHSFDCSAVAVDFGRDIEEETILECFERRRRIQRSIEKKTL